MKVISREWEWWVKNMSNEQLMRKMSKEYE